MIAAQSQPRCRAFGSSPAVNSGVMDNVYATFQQRYGVSIAFDKDGNARGGASTDMGAYLANGSAVAPPPTPPPASDNCVPAAMPDPPSNLTLVKQGGGTISLAWTKPGGCGVPTSYVVEAGTAPGLADAATTTTPDNSVKYQSSNLPAGTFYVRVRGKNVGGIGAPSNEVVVGGAPGPPQNLRATVAGSMVTITWDPPTTGGTANGYIVEAGSGPGKLDIAAAIVTAPATSKTGPAPMNTYYVRVRAASVVGVSDPSNEVVVVVK